MNKDKFKFYGTSVYRKDDKYHREYISGYKKYLINGKLHREDGPAIEDENGNGNKYSEEEYWGLIKLKVFI